MHLPDWVDLEYANQLTAEKSIRKYVKGKGATRQWVKTRERNEALDLAVMALAALHILGPVFVRSLRDRAAQWALSPESRLEVVSEEAQLAARLQALNRRKRSWVHRWRY